MSSFEVDTQYNRRNARIYGELVHGFAVIHDTLFSVCRNLDADSQKYETTEEIASDFFHGVSEKLVPGSMRQIKIQEERYYMKRGARKLIGATPENYSDLHTRERVTEALLKEIEEDFEMKRVYPELFPQLITYILELLQTVDKRLYDRLILQLKENANPTLADLYYAVLYLVPIIKYRQQYGSTREIVEGTAKSSAQIFMSMQIIMNGLKASSEASDLIAIPSILIPVGRTALKYMQSGVKTSQTMARMRATDHEGRIGKKHAAQYSFLQTPMPGLQKQQSFYAQYGITEQ